MPQTEVLTPKALKERLAEERAAQKRGWFNVAIGDSGPASRRIALSDDEKGATVLSRLGHEDAPPRSVVVHIREGQAKQLARQGLVVGPAEAPEVSKTRPAPPKTAAEKAEEALRLKALAKQLGDGWPLGAASAATASLVAAGFDSVDKVREAGEEEVTKLDHVGPATWKLFQPADDGETS